MANVSKNVPLCEGDPVTIVDLLENGMKAANYSFEILDPNTNKTTLFEGAITQTQLDSLAYFASLLKFE